VFWEVTSQTQFHKYPSEYWEPRKWK